MSINSRFLAWLAAIAIPLLYLLRYSPYGMDTTDFGYFYAYAWRILQDQIPYRDFYYIKPALPLYWHAFWMWLTPENIQVLAGKAAFCLSLLLSSWLGCLYLAKFFNLARMGLSLPILATTAFVFSIHSFPHMPWHTADGVLFCAAALYLGASRWPIAAGMAAGAATLCKQSFAPAPLMLFLLLWLVYGKKDALRFLASTALVFMAWVVWLMANNAWTEFREMTTGQLNSHEALEAGIYIYLRQNWLLPLLALLPAALERFFPRIGKKWTQPSWWYLAILCVWYLLEASRRQAWIGFGASWPTLFMLLGGIAVLFPNKFLQPLLNRPETGKALPTAVILACPLAVAWCAAISGGYKIPAFFAAPLLFSFFLIHAHFYGGCQWLQCFALLVGIAMFGYGYQYPYVFPARPLERAQLTEDAGQVYKKASGVKVEKDMLERLEELRRLRQKYGANYTALPGFSFAYYLNGDKPVVASDWPIDWEINGKVDELYKELMDKNVIVFMERDQMDARQADAYARAGYGAPQLVRHNWEIIDETPHFVIFKRPDQQNGVNEPTP